jgi:putative chitobiose transport system permease protein
LSKAYKPFSIYDDDEEKKPVESPSDLSHLSEDNLSLEIEDGPTTEYVKAREDLLKQLGLDKADGSDTPKSSKSIPSETLENAPFLQGQVEQSVEERAKSIIQDRRETGKIRDRRKIASIFDKPIEPDKAITPGRARWHPLSYRAQSFWFLFPALILFVLFYLYPMVKGFQISLTHYSPLGDSVSVGWDNYQRAFQDSFFWQTVVNAVAFTLASIIIGFWPPIILSILLNEMTRGKGLLKVLYLLPFVIPAVPAANLWRWMFDDGFGVLNSILQWSTGEPNLQVGWLSDPRWALLSIVAMFVWKNIGWFMLIYYASLQNLPEELYEAAELDGAPITKKLINITIPYLMPVVQVLLIIQVLTTFQIFTEVYVMTNGGPMHSTEVIGTYIYKTAFGAMDLGYASAMAMLMFGALLLFSVIRLYQLKQVTR